jgi:enamine deaminase RidA (YjgF/YER057c/UK114 family)
MSDPQMRRQWMPLDEVGEPYRSRLLEIYSVFPRTHSQPAHFDLSTDAGTGRVREIWISGQVPRFENEIRYQGVVGLDTPVETAREAARLALANLLSILAAACDGDLGRVDRFVRLTGYIRSTSHFIEHSRVIDAASEILHTLFGARGRHVRSAIGVSSLPGGASVELECVVLLKASDRP